VCPTQDTGGTRDIATDDESSHERGSDTVTGLVGDVVNHDHVEAVKGAEFAEGIDVTLGSVAESEILTHNDTLRSQALDERVANNVGRTQVGKLIGEGEHKTGIDAGLPDEFDTTIRSRDISRHTFGGKEAGRVSIKRDHHGVQLSLLGNLPGSPNHFDMPAVDGVELSDGDG
jgi:hypothetical protein